MHRFEELKIWKKAMDVVESCYRVAVNFPKEEKYNLTSQIRQSVVSIPSNIAEGAGRNTGGEFKQFFRHRQWLFLRITKSIISFRKT